MKGAVDLITLIIVACMVVSIGLMLWFYLNSYYSQVSQTGEARTQRSLETLSSCMRIEEATQNKFFIRNCGQGVITNDTLNVYVDGEITNFDLAPTSIDAGKTGTLSIQGVWSMSIGQHYLRITNPNFETSAMFDAELPDSCVTVLDLEFDEGSGTTAKDSSPYGNDGTLYSGTSICSNPPTSGCPKWTQGIYGSALEFDGINDFVSVSNDKSINIAGDYTIELWVKRNMKTGYQYLVYKEENCNGYGIAIDDSSRVLIYFGNGTNCGGFWLRTTSSYTPSTGQFYHLMGTHTSGKQKIYVNGNETSLVSGGNYVGNPLSTSTPLNIGRHATSGYYFNGTIDSVRICSQSLTPDQTLNFRII